MGYDTVHLQQKSYAYVAMKYKLGMTLRYLSWMVLLIKLIKAEWRLVDANPLSEPMLEYC